MPSLSQRLKSVTKQVEKWERDPSLVGAMAMGLIAEALPDIEAITSTRKRGGRPKTSDASLLGLLRAVDAYKARRGIDSDSAALAFLARHMLDLRGMKAKQWVKTHANRLPAARKLRGK